MVVWSVLLQISANCAISRLSIFLNSALALKRKWRTVCTSTRAETAWLAKRAFTLIYLRESALSWKWRRKLSTACDTRTPWSAKSAPKTTTWKEECARRSPFKCRAALFRTPVTAKSATRAKCYIPLERGAFLCLSRRTASATVTWVASSVRRDSFWTKICTFQKNPTGKTSTTSQNTSETSIWGLSTSEGLLLVKRFWTEIARLSTLFLNAWSACLSTSWGKIRPARDILWLRSPTAKFTPVTISVSSASKGFSWLLLVSARQLSQLTSAVSTIPLLVLLFVLSARAIFMSWTISVSPDSLLSRIVRSRPSITTLVRFVPVGSFLLLISWSVCQKYSTVSLTPQTMRLWLASCVRTSTT